MKDYAGQLFAFSRDGDTVRYRGKGFELGTYAMRDGSSFSLTAEEFDTLTLPAFTRVKNELEHFDSVDRKPNLLTDKLGDLVGLQRVGNEIIATADVPYWLTEVIGDKPIGVSLVFDESKAVVSAGLTIDPRFEDAQLYAAFSNSQAPAKETKTNMNLLEAANAILAHFSKNPAADLEVPGTKPVTTDVAAFTAVPDPKLVAELEAAKKERDDLLKNAQESNVAFVAAFANSFADGEITAKRLTDAEKPLFVEELIQAATDDNVGKLAAFSNAGLSDGPRVARIKARQEMREPVTVWAPGAKTPSTDAMTADRKKELTAFSGDYGAQAAKEIK